ncbi:PE-PGRS family protein [Streptomyces sp. Amel2xB2]|uniref:PE-PGRS family protein n=1 Tax=Streptomyces sp. Amel2xB2 TaxID=1305829 RepID=UPI0021AD099C|nr:PE-PGRS family protein [Streptomyces sp. Amel2xB2]
MSGRPVPVGLLLGALPAAALAAWAVAGRERGPVVVGVLTVGTQALLHGLFSLGQALAGSGASGASSLGARWAAALVGHPLAGAPDSPAGGGTSYGAHAAHGVQGMQGMHGTNSMHSMSGVHGGGMGHHAHDATVHQATHHAMNHQGMGQAAMDHAHAGMPGGTSGMIAIHLLVALLSAWWLWGGERAVFRAVRAVRAASLRLFAPLVAAADVALPAPAPTVRAARPERTRAPRRLFLGHVIWLRGPPHGRAV